MAAAPAATYLPPEHHNIAMDHLFEDLLAAEHVGIAVGPAGDSYLN